MKVMQNPMLYGFTVLYKNRKGRFVKDLRSAHYVIVKHKSKRGKIKSFTFNVSEFKTAKQKANAIGHYLVQKTYKDDERKKGKKKKYKRVPNLIQFTVDKVKKVIILKDNKKLVPIDKYYFDMRKIAKFTKDHKKVDQGIINKFFNSMMSEMQKLFKKHKKGKYFIRVRQEAEKMKKRKDGKGWTGYSLGRVEIKNKSDLFDQVEVLQEMFQESMEYYLSRAIGGSFFFSGFSVEYTK